MDTAERRTSSQMTIPQPGAETWRSDAWWLFLVTGIVWLIFAMIVLQFDIDSVAAIALAAGIVMVAAGLNEFLALLLFRGWGWLHAVLGVLFIAAGILAMAWPDVTFVALARVLAWYLLFKGTFDIVIALVQRGHVELWWTVLIAGIFEVLLAFWAAGYPGRAATLLVLWVGFSALTRGVTEIILAFQLRGLRDASKPVHEVASV
jgi:uncharacterized membrane protein HdeD (DUF308 family)